MPEDITNRRFGLLTCIRQTEEKSGFSFKWEFVCDCGNKVLVSYNNIVRGKQKSCGCYRKTFSKTHGMSKERIYSLYNAMVSRVKYNGYKNHNGRGIKVCDRWLESFENFYEDMGYSYKEGLELDRRNVNADYTPENCRWVDKSLQSFNKRIDKRNKSGKTGVYQQKGKTLKWLAKITKNGKSIHLGSFNTYEGAVDARILAEIKYFGETKY